MRESAQDVCPHHGAEMTFTIVVAELKSWQPLIGSILGFGALTWGALYNFDLNRKRDDRARDLEALTVALALYSEMKLLRSDIAALATGIARHFLRYQRDDLPAYWLESYSLREPTLYNALAPKIGLLPPTLLLQITEFYSNYMEATAYFPRLIKNDKRQISYGVGWVLRPAIAAVEGAAAALQTIEAMGKIESPAGEPSTGQAKQALKLEADMHPDED